MKFNKILILFVTFVLCHSFQSKCFSAFLPVIMTPNTVIVNDRPMLADTSYYKLILELGKAKFFERIVMHVDSNVLYWKFFDLIDFFVEHNLMNIYFYSSLHEDLYSFEPNRMNPKFKSKRDSLKLTVIIREKKVEIGYRKSIETFGNKGNEIDTNAINDFLAFLSTEAKKTYDASEVIIAADSFIKFKKVEDVIFLCHKNGFYDKSFAKTIKNDE